MENSETTAGGAECVGCGLEGSEACASCSPEHRAAASRARKQRLDRLRGAMLGADASLGERIAAAAAERLAGKAAEGPPPVEEGPVDAGMKPRGRPFKPGQSGNPAGRPRGARGKTTELCMELLDGDAAGIMARLIEGAKAGKPQLLKLCLERLVPVRAARDRVIELEGMPRISKAVDLVEAWASLIDHAGDGDVTLSEAREFGVLLDQQRKAIETAELQVRVEALESGAAKPSGPVGFAPPEAAPVDVSLSARVRRLAPRPQEEVA